jgi:hypothetical protein
MEWRIINHQRDDADDDWFSLLVSLHREHADGSQWSCDLSTINGTMLMLMDFRFWFHSTVNTPMIQVGSELSTINGTMPMMIDFRLLIHSTVSFTARGVYSQSSTASFRWLNHTGVFSVSSPMVVVERRNSPIVIGIVPLTSSLLVPPAPWVHYVTMGNALIWFLYYLH